MPPHEPREGEGQIEATKSGVELPALRGPLALPGLDEEAHCKGKGAQRQQLEDSPDGRLRGLQWAYEEDALREEREVRREEGEAKYQGNGCSVLHDTSADRERQVATACRMARAHSAIRPPGRIPSRMTAAPFIDITMRASVEEPIGLASTGSSKYMTFTTRR